jgi:GxxExxY protein
MELLHKDLTYQIRSCIFEVRKEIGVGFDEETYHQGLMLSFERRNMPFLSKEKRSLLHREILIRDFVNDYLLFDKIILSLKCVPCKFLQAHYVQLFSELKLWRADVGMMVNFGLPKLNIERYAFTEKEPEFVENFEFIKDRVSKAEQPILEQITKAIKDVAILHKPGYGKVVWRKILEAELNYLQIPFSKNRIVPVSFAGKTIRTYRLRHLIVEDKILLAVTALQKGIDQIDVANMQSYLKTLNLGIGVIVNFGKSKVHISGVRAPKS